MIGMEAGQSAVGDVYAWFRNMLAWPVKNIPEWKDGLSEIEIESLIEKIIPVLSGQAEQIPVDENSEFSMDWFNGRRSPDANAQLKAGMAGLNLGTDAPRIFRSLVESTCFGAKAIVDRFLQQGVPVKGLIGMGGVAKKSDFIMQMMADVLNLPIRISKSEQTSALGAAMFAATAAGIYPKVEEAMKAMGHGFEKTILPDKNKNGLYEKRYVRYQAFGKFMEKQMNGL
jgi:L-ribulokinase